MTDYRITFAVMAALNLLVLPLVGVIFKSRPSVPAVETQGS